MTAAQRAAFRILCSTPRDRVHTHHHNPLPVRIQGKHLGDIPEGLIEELRRLLEGGASREAICRELRMGDRLYRRIRSIIDKRKASISLNERRAQIKHLLSQGVAERRIAVIVGISRTAVQNHKRQLQMETASVADSRYADIPTL